MNLLIKLFAGEFGHELMRWQGCVRKLAKEYDNVFVECKEGHESLYEDFATKLIRYKIVSSSVVNCSVFKGIVKRLDNISIPEKIEIIRPCLAICDKQINQDFVSYGKHVKDLEYDIVIHARNDSRIIKYGDRNWPIEDWNKVVASFPKKRIASIGSPNASHYIEGTDNLRGISLSKLADILKSSKLCVGPSSGPMHFASLCGCRHLLWAVKGPKGMKVGGGAETMVERYGISWNPFNTTCKVVDKWDWRPPSGYISECIKEML